MSSATPPIVMQPTATIQDNCYFPGKIHEPLISKGTVILDGHLPLPCDILFDYNVSIVMRDGLKLYADVYRPPLAKTRTVPAIIVAGPFGKNGGPNRYHFDKFPWRMGCPRAATSGLEKFEGLDPAYWVANGYAIVNLDSRGSWNSEGDVFIGCTKEGQDGYDAIEWIAEQSWCNGKVSMAGNSYLAQTQWFVGAERPPHLACLAPWEGWSSVYHDTVRRGGIPNPGFIHGLLATNLASCNGGNTENIDAMTNLYPIFNKYWEDRVAKLSRIQCPLYIVASWTNALHTGGTFRGWTEIPSSQKWLRVHNTHEWPDLYDSRNIEDLRCFYDYFMKGANNDWIYTPKVRISVLDAGGLDIINRPEFEFPLKRQEIERLYLDSAEKSLVQTAPSTMSMSSYDATSGAATFTIVFDTEKEFTGYSNLVLWAEAIGSDDMDLFVIVQKLSDTGILLESPLVDVGRMANDPEEERRVCAAKHAQDHSFCEGYFASGPTGCLRVSHRELDPVASTELKPVLLHKEEKLLRPSEVVRVEVALWPYGMLFRKGQKLRLTVSGVNPRPHLRPSDVRPKLRNSGVHRIYTGGERASYILLPLIPRHTRHD